MKVSRYTNRTVGRFPGTYRTVGRFPGTYRTVGRWRFPDTYGTV